MANDDPPSWAAAITPSAPPGFQPARRHQATIDRRFNRRPHQLLPGVPETASGATTARPVLDQVLDQLRPGDTLVVWKLERLGRSGTAESATLPDIC